MDVFKVLLDQFLNNPMFQGVMVSLLVSKLRDFFKSLDLSTKDPAKVKNVQLIVVVLSAAVTLLNAWSQGKLGQIDPELIKNFVEVLVVSLGTHQLGKDVKKVAGKNGK